MTDMAFKVEVTGWDADGESVYWEGYGSTEEDAIADAVERGRIVEIGDANVVRAPR